MKPIFNNDLNIQNSYSGDDESGSSEEKPVSSNNLESFSSSELSNNEFTRQTMGLTFLALGASQCLVTAYHFSTCLYQNSTSDYLQTSVDQESKPTDGPSCITKSISMGAMGLMCIFYGTTLYRPDLYIAAQEKMGKFCINGWNRISPSIKEYSDEIALRAGNIYQKGQDSLSQCLNARSTGDEIDQVNEEKLTQVVYNDVV